MNNGDLVANIKIVANRMYDTGFVGRADLFLEGARRLEIFAQACEKLADLDCCTGYSVKDDDLPKLWEALELARDGIEMSLGDPDGRLARKHAREKA